MTMTKQNKRNINFHHRYGVQMRFNDFDMFGHLNNTVYFEYLDMAKYAYFKQFMDGAFGTEPTVPVILKIDAVFLSPVHIDDSVEVLTAVTALGDTSLTLSQQLVDNAGNIKFTAEVIMVNIDVKTQQPATIGDKWRKEFTAFEQENLHNK